MIVRLRWPPRLPMHPHRAGMVPVPVPVPVPLRRPPLPHLPPRPHLPSLPRRPLRASGQTSPALHAWLSGGRSAPSNARRGSREGQARPTPRRSDHKGSSRASLQRASTSVRTGLQLYGQATQLCRLMTGSLSSISTASSAVDVRPSPCRPTSDPRDLLTHTHTHTLY